ncbi:hypothetical protein FKW77_003730 [Venturia effusa]|uniref:F-box domain-containing protein n=1 Tax=Venturia effusa TaxID=50376 RepID=A0A517LGX5_9PEZI|nr:hypothetical protein FKW77_003730 [Venturia effusa]
MEFGEEMADSHGASEQARQFTPFTTTDAGRALPSISGQSQLGHKEASLQSRSFYDMTGTSNLDSDETTGKNHTLLTIPTEILEHIASSCNPKGLLNLRLTNKKVAKRTSDAFLNQFLKCMYWSPHTSRNPLVERIDALKLNPKFAPAVKQLTVCLGHTYNDFVYDDFANGVAMLQNLRSLTLDRSFGSYAVKAPITVPQLEVLAVTNCYGVDCRLAVALIASHTASLRSILFKNVSLSCYGLQDKSAWPKILEAVRLLRADVLLEISVPCTTHYLEIWGVLVFFVVFSPPPKVFDPERHPLHVFIGEKHGWVGVHYSTIPGELQTSLDFMLRNYKELTPGDEEFEYDVVGGPVIDTSSGKWGNESDHESENKPDHGEELHD